MGFFDRLKAKTRGIMTAAEPGYTFHWSDLRDPVIAAVTGAGWTYKPKTI